MSIRLNKVARDLNVGIQTAVDFLQKKGFSIESNPNTKISDEQYALLVKEFSKDKNLKIESERISQERHNKDKNKATVSIDGYEEQPAIDKELVEPQEIKTEIAEEYKPKIKQVGKIDLDNLYKPVSAQPASISEPTSDPEPEVVEEPEEEELIQPEPEIESEPEEESVLEADEEMGTELEEDSYEEEEEVIPEEIEEEENVELEEGEEEEKDSEIFTLRTPKLTTNINVVGKIDLNALNQQTRPKKKSKEEKRKEREAKEKMRQDQKRMSKADVDNRAIDTDVDKKKRKRIKKEKIDIEKSAAGISPIPRPIQQKSSNKQKLRKPVKAEISEEDVQKQIKETLARLTTKGPVNNVIATCMSIGIMVSINQRLDAETINIVADEFGFRTEYVSAEVVEAINVEEDREEDLTQRPPIVTVMGHVDHGKTSLLDYIRNANVIAGEAGGITQHIGAYNVKLEDGRRITFLDTPGHEAFTAMRARGAKVTDIAIIIVAADDNVMPQTVEAINHASAAGVPIVFAINKIDKPSANPDKIKEELANMNYLVEEWGGKYQSQEISAKKGTGVHELMEKVLLEAELLDLKANPDRRATGSVIESTLDKGRGYVATILVENGTLHTGDIVLAGTHYGRVKAMFNERNSKISEAGPSAPALILGLNGAPQAGDVFHVMESEQEARDIANKREQLQRELGLRTHKLLTLDDIGRRIAIGNFQELNVIVKGDVDGSVEALSDSLIKLSTEEIQVNVLHKAVGQISESDITLAAASNAIIIGFQVRPSMAARKLAEKEGVDIRLYSIIYDAIEEVKSAMEGMLSPEIKEEITATVEVRETFRITKVGTVAGCMVKEGKIKRSNKIRLIRDGIVIYSGELGSLKRFKDDVKEVATGYECGLNITNYNDVKVGDLIEAYEEVEVKKTL